MRKYTNIAHLVVYFQLYTNLRYDDSYKMKYSFKLFIFIILDSIFYGDLSSKQMLRYFTIFGWDRSLLYSFAV